MGLLAQPAANPTNMQVRAVLTGCGARYVDRGFGDHGVDVGRSVGRYGCCVGLLAFLRDYKKGCVCARGGEVNWYLGLLGFILLRSTVLRPFRLVSEW